MVEPTLIISTSLNGRSGSESIFIRPVNSVTVNSNYFMPGVMGGDHALKIGGYWRDSQSSSYSHRGGYATVRFPNETAFNNDACATQAAGCQVDLDARRQQRVRPDEHRGLRAGHLHAQPADDAARSPIRLGSTTRRWRRRSTPTRLSLAWLPAISFPGADPKVFFNNFSPRVGLTFDLRRDGRTIARANYARYYGQVGNGGVAGTINPVGATTLRYPWVDLNGDKVAEANEVIAQRQAVLGEHQLVGGQPGQHGVGQLGRSEPQERHDRRSASSASTTRSAPGSPSERATSGAGTAISRGTIVSGITTADWAPVSFTPSASLVPGRRQLPDGDLLPADLPATDRRHRTDQRPGLQPQLQRRRADGQQAAVEPLDDEHELLVQQHDREFRGVPGQPAEHRGARRFPRIRPTARCATATSTTTSRAAAGSATSTSTRSGCTS